MKCPYRDCNFEETKEQKFLIIKTIKTSSSVIRGRVCPKCGRSFKGVEVLTTDPFYKRELAVGFRNQ